MQLTWKFFHLQFCTGLFTFVHTLLYFALAQVFPAVDKTFMWIHTKNSKHFMQMILFLCVSIVCFTLDCTRVHSNIRYLKKLFIKCLSGRNLNVSSLLVGKINHFHP